jgi:FKBP-type peptidyl-prolyl cis-trans isomerase
LTGGNSVIASEAKQSSAGDEAGLDCFVASLLAMTRNLGFGKGGGIGMGGKMIAAAGLWLAVGSMAAAQSVAEPAAPARDAAWHNAQMLYLLDLKAGNGWRIGPGGLRYRRIKAGAADSPSPAATDTVTIHYAGRFIDGAEFDSSIARGEPATFPLPRLIRGWQEGVPLMRVGDTFEFAIPPAMAYGPNGKGPIPGGATLLFTVELLGIAEGDAPE